jgi:hypothetical protein
VKGILFWGGAASIVIGGSANFAVNQIATGSDNSGSPLVTIYPSLAFINNNAIWFVLGGLLAMLIAIFL